MNRTVSALLGSVLLSAPAAPAAVQAQEVSQRELKNALAEVQAMENTPLAWTRLTKNICRALNQGASPYKGAIMLAMAFGEHDPNQDIQDLVSYHLTKTCTTASHKELYSELKNLESELSQS